ncbi:MAG: terpene cyclase/mutase family protein [Planctomycetes bacterium]|nr:terpene cyclase/mutase family protein [Planctomycetota bacterium]
MKYKKLLVLIVIMGVFFLALPALAKNKKDPGESKVSPAKVDAAINRGAKVLLEIVKPLKMTLTDYHKNKHSVRTDELILYTLIHAGMQDEPAFKRLLQKVLSNELDLTYHVALRAMALEALDRKKYQEHLRNCAQFLIDNQCQNGQWDYGRPTRVEEAKIITPRPGQKKTSGTKSIKRIRIKAQRKGPAKGDNSNSQYASLGLRACLQAGIVIPEDVLRKAKQWWVVSQTADGGWNYAPRGQTGAQPGQLPPVNPPPSFSSYGSMTAGGVACLCIYDFFLKKKMRKDASIKRGLSWLADNFTVMKNVKYTNPKKHHYYYLYALERVGMLAETKSFGQHDWYAEGANYLLANQQKDGSWNNKEIDTCFAILFLRRATKPLRVIITK